MSGDASNLDDLGDEGIVEQEIVNEMDEVRSKLGGGIDRLNEEMRHVFDWQSYVRSAPLTSVGLAVAVGYLFAPAIRSTPAPQPVQSQDNNSSGGIFGTLTSLAFGTILRYATNYATEMFMSQAAPPPGETHQAYDRPVDRSPDLGL